MTRNTFQSLNDEYYRGAMFTGHSGAMFTGYSGAISTLLEVLEVRGAMFAGP